MPQRTIVITGASDGIGRAAAERIAEAGERVVVVGRNPERTRAVAAALGAPHHLADFAELDQVRRLAAELLEAYPRIDALGNNAGGSFPAGARSVDGFALTVQVDHLAPYLLTRLLLPRLLESRATVAVTASMAAQWGRVRRSELERQRFGPSWRAYGTAKLMNVMFAVELQRRFGAEGLAAVALHPGVIATSFGSNGSPVFKALYGLRLAKTIMAPPARGGDELARLLLGEPGVDWPAGGFVERGGVRPLPRPARDPRRLELLWEWSAAATGLAGGDLP